MRTRRMMEESMESGAAFRGSELLSLCQNPIVHAILRPLVFLLGEQTGFLKPENGALFLEHPDGSQSLVEAKEELRIAHPYHLYQSGIWHQYQELLFRRQIRQPFKQVFRELYRKLPEELGLTASRMFAGNQIQPQKTVGCLRGRRWVADYEEGLQKIYYKENIVARIYALADWFSPSDIEAPTLEWVEFFDRRTFRSLTIEQVPDLIYSEVMRDVDLAVSVAHAGGVDPETSHSTIEMRRRIMELNLPLFGLTNVTLKDSHALIQGAERPTTFIWAAVSFIRRAAPCSTSCRSTVRSAGGSSFPLWMRIRRLQRSCPRSCCWQKTGRSRIRRSWTRSGRIFLRA